MSLCKSPTSFATAETNRLLSTITHSPFFRPRSRKAPPTVSLTNAIASCTYASTSVNDISYAQNVIPFPTSSIPFPTSDEPECVSLLCAGLPNMPRPRVRPRASQIEFRHRRSKARLAQSPLARKDGQRSRSRSPDVNVRTGKRSPATDMQLLAMVYRTVTSHLGCVEPPFGEISALCGEDAMEVIEVQERLLVQRLSESMVELGCSPFPIINGSAKDPESAMVVECHPLAGFDCDSSPLPSSPFAAASRLDESRVLTMPQLVAKLLLRHGERARRRAASRVRPSGSERIGVGSAAKSSPLAMTVDA